MAPRKNKLISINRQPPTTLVSNNNNNSSRFSFDFNLDTDDDSLDIISNRNNNNNQPITTTTTTKTVSTSPSNNEEEEDEDDEDENDIINYEDEEISSIDLNKIDKSPPPPETKTIRIEISSKHLKRRHGDVNYKSLVRRYLKKQNNLDNNNNNNNDIAQKSNNRLTQVINKIELINRIGSAINTVNQVDDSEDEYDINDSFIDKDYTEINYDLETEYGGYFINKGDIKYKEEEEDDDNEEDDEEEVQLKKRKNNKSPSPPPPPPLSQITNLIDLNSSEIENLIVQLENQIKKFKASNDSTYFLPKKCNSLLAKLYEKLKKTNQNGNLPGIVITRLSNVWGIKENTIKHHLKKAFLEKENSK